MKVFLVGGAVRDKLMGLPVQDCDWVVVGSTPDCLLKQGYKPVGHGFPVFLHPKTHEEYALARTERKVGHGYQGFETCYDSTVTLEQDLKRRDLTINAMAMTEQGRLIDPWGGLKDLRSKTLRHVSEAFIEDPLRVLRVARFYGRFYTLGFKIESQTQALMKTLAESGELDYLTPERVWAELEKALNSTHPEIFIETLYETKALAAVFPQVSMLLESVQDSSTSLPLRALALAGQQELASTPVKLACLLHSLNSEVINVIKLPLPTRFLGLAKMVSQYYQIALNVRTLSAQDCLQLLDSLDAFRQANRFEQFLKVITILEQIYCIDIASSQFLEQAFLQCKAIIAQPFIAQGLQGKAVGKAIRLARIACIEQLKLNQ